MEKKSLIKLNFKQNEQDLIKKIKYLLSNGAKINEKNYAGNTAIAMCVMRNKNKILKYLLSNGAIQTTLNDNLTSPLFLTVLFGNKEANKILLKDAIKKNKKDLIQSLDTNGRTLAIYAFLEINWEINETFEIFENVLKYSNYLIDIERRDNENNTLLDYITKVEPENSHKAIKILRKYINKEFNINEQSKEILNDLKNKLIENTKKIKEKSELDLDEDFSFL
jgi:ankyrin repeat protein